MMVVDAAVLNLAERLCHKVQQLTGRTNVWLALQLTNLSIIIYFVWAGAIFWRGDVGLRVLLGLFFAALLYGLSQTVFRVPIEAYEASAYRRVSKGLRNPRRLRDALLRLLFLSLSVLLSVPFLFLYVTLRIHIVLLTYSLIALTTMVLYLLACDPLPPCTGTVTEWLQQPTGMPVPVPKRAVMRPRTPGGGRAVRQPMRASAGGHDQKTAQLVWSSS